MTSTITLFLFLFLKFISLVAYIRQATASDDFETLGDFLVDVSSELFKW